MWITRSQRLVLLGKSNTETPEGFASGAATSPTGAIKTRQSVSRVLFRTPVRRSEGDDDHSSRPAIAGRLSRPTRTLSASDGLSDARPARGPYSVLLQAGLAMPSL